MTVQPPEHHQYPQPRPLPHPPEHRGRTSPRTPRHGHPRRPVQTLICTVLGLSLIAIGVALIVHVHDYKQHAKTEAARLARTVAAPTPTSTREIRCTAPQPSRPTPAGTARAVLTIPAIGLTAPILAGTSDTALDVGVGHLDTSRWPNQGGTGVLEAHNVTFFTHLPNLHPGDPVTITSRCRSWTYTVTNGRTVHSGTPIPNLPAPTLVLVTCWPTNALYYTNTRYVVTASLAHASNAAPTLPPAPKREHITAAIPKALAARNLDANSNGIYLGTLTNHNTDTAGKPATVVVFQQGNQAHRILVAARIAATEHRRDWWHTLAPHVPWKQAHLLTGGTWTGSLDTVINTRAGRTGGGVMTGHLTTGHGNRTVTVTVAVTHRGKLVIRGIVLRG